MGVGFRQEIGKPLNEVFTLLIIREYITALYSSDRDPAERGPEGPGGIQACGSWHGSKMLSVKLFDYLKDIPQIQIIRGANILKTINPYGRPFQRSPVPID